MLTSKHNIIWSIASATRNWDYVFYVKFFAIDSTVIALIMLLLLLKSNVFLRERSFSMFQSLPVSGASFNLFRVIFIILSVLFSYAISIFISPISRLLNKNWPFVNVMLLSTYTLLFLVFLMKKSVLLMELFRIIFTRIALFFQITRFALSIKAKKTSLVVIKILDRYRVLSSTFRTYAHSSHYFALMLLGSITYWIGSISFPVIFPMAKCTDISDAKFSRGIFWEVVRICGQPPIGNTFWMNTSVFFRTLPEWNCGRIETHAQDAFHEKEVGRVGGLAGRDRRFYFNTPVLKLQRVEINS